eukprot:3416508-Rhodomonas_salina.2
MGNERVKTKHSVEAELALPCVQSASCFSSQHCAQTLQMVSAASICWGGGRPGQATRTQTPILRNTVSSSPGNSYTAQPSDLVTQEKFSPFVQSEISETRVIEPASDVVLVFNWNVCFGTMWAKQET